MPSARLSDKNEPVDISAIRDAIEKLESVSGEGYETQSADMDSWLLPYVDTVTTLLALYAFFISLMELPSATRADIQAEIHSAFVKPSLIELPEIKIEIEAAKYLPNAEELIRVIKSNGLEREVAINIENGRATLIISDAIVFAPGSPEISIHGESVLRALGPALNEMPGTITVAGHTDATPVANAAYESNLDLSFARAKAVIDLYTSLRIPAERFRAIANAATAPVADDGTMQGRSANRRVEISVELN